jgi:hypothetical protein
LIKKLELVILVSILFVFLLTLKLASGQSSPNIVLLSKKFKENDRFGLGRIIGEVKNIGNDSATSIEIIGTVYDENGDLITTQNTFADNDTKYIC